MSSSDYPLLEPPPVESWSEKGTRKFKENPFVPIGFGASIAALLMGANKIRVGADPNQLNWWMRARIGAHAFTVAACCIGIYVAAAKNPEKANQLRQRAEDEMDFARRMKNAEYEYNGAELISKGGRLRARAPVEDDGIPVVIRENFAPEPVQEPVKETPAPVQNSSSRSWLRMLWNRGESKPEDKP